MPAKGAYSVSAAAFANAWLQIQQTIAADVQQKRGEGVDVHACQRFLGSSRCSSCC
jgi:hypothetical protein